MTLPKRQGLSDPAFEHDACGLGFMATLRHKPMGDIVQQGLEILENLTHRGAAGCNACAGDGAGVLIQIRTSCSLRKSRPWGWFFRGQATTAWRCASRRRLPVVANSSRSSKPRCGTIGNGCSAGVPYRCARLPLVPSPVTRCPLSCNSSLGANALPSYLEHVLYMIRKRAGRVAGSDNFYICSCSSKTIVYKGLMLAEQVDPFIRISPTPQPRADSPSFIRGFQRTRFPPGIAPIPTGSSPTTVRSTRSVAKSA